MAPLSEVYCPPGHQAYEDLATALATALKVGGHGKKNKYARSYSP